MQFAPKTEDQLRTQNLIPDDTECDFEVVESKHAVSKKGNEMIALKLRVFSQSRESFVFDYLMESMGFKLLHFCEATNKTSQYASGNLRAEDCERATGKCVVSIEPASGNYAAKNVISDYIGHRETKSVKINATIQKPATQTVETDDVPF